MMCVFKRCVSALLLMKKTSSVFLSEMRCNECEMCEMKCVVCLVTQISVVLMLRVNGSGSVVCFEKLST